MPKTKEEKEAEKVAKKARREQRIADRKARKHGADEEQSASPAPEPPAPEPAPQSAQTELTPVTTEPERVVVTTTEKVYYYAGPTKLGLGNGSSDANRFLIADFWKVAKPGVTCYLADGTYQGSASVITPPPGLSGERGKPITVKASSDGGPLIDGQRIRNAVFLSKSSWFVLEGFDARNGAPDAVVRFGMGSNYNVVRRVCAWDAWPLEGNTSVFANNGNVGNMWEDIAFFGVARKGFETSQGGNNATIRRAWGMWQQNTRTGPKMTFGIAYNSRNVIAENCIGTWSEVGSAVEKYGVFGMDGTNDGKGVFVNSKYLGCIGYVQSRLPASGLIGGLFGSRSIDGFEFKDVVMYVEPINIRPIFAQRFDGGGSVPTAGNPSSVPAGNRKLTNITTIGGASSYVDRSWTVSEYIAVPRVGDAPSIWNGTGTKGARVGYRYINGVLTTKPLWPWPMDARIRQAMIRSGRSPDAVFGGAGNSVTRQMEILFGPIPKECRI